MDLGPLNRRLHLFANNPVKGLGGAVKDVLTHLKWLPVTLGDITESRLRMTGIGSADSAEVLDVGRDASMGRSAFTTRYYPGVKNNQFFDFEGQRFRVERFKMLGRREGMVIYGTSLS